MISNVSNTTPQTTTPTAPATPSASSGSAASQTPFGQVLVDQTSGPNIYALFNGAMATPSSSSAASATAATTPAAQTTAAQTAAAQTTGASATADAQPDPTPTLQSVFGTTPWVANPGGTGPYGAAWQYNPIYFATEATAEKVASMVGGTVVEESAMLGPGPMVQNQSNEMVKLANGQIINPGLVASFYTHGYPQSYIDRLLQNEVQGA